MADPRTGDLFDDEVLAVMLDNDSGDLLSEVLEAQKIVEVQVADGATCPSRTCAPR